MAKALLIENQRVRDIVVSLLMTVLLLLSLAVAGAVSAPSGPELHAVAVGGMTFSVPQRWAEREPVSGIAGLGEQVTLVDGDDAQAARHLVLGAFESRVMRNALWMLGAVVPQMIGAAAQGPVDVDQPVNYRLGRLEGARLVARSRAGGRVQIHRITVMTAGGARYWVAHMYATYDSVESSRAVIARDDAVYEQVVRSVRLTEAAEDSHE